MPAPLNPYTQEFLGREEKPLPGIGVGMAPSKLQYLSPLPEEHWVDQVVCTAARHASFMARTEAGSQPRQCPGVCQKGSGILFRDPR